MVHYITITQTKLKKAHGVERHRELRFHWHASTGTQHRELPMPVASLLQPCGEEKCLEWQAPSVHLQAALCEEATPSILPATIAGAANYARVLAGASQSVDLAIELQWASPMQVCGPTLGAWHCAATNV